MEQKKTPTALDYLVVHHVCRAYLRSVNHIANGKRDDLVSELYEESIQFLAHFINIYEINQIGLDSETKKVLGIIKLSMNNKESFFIDRAPPSKQSIH